MVAGELGIVTMAAEPDAVVRACALARSVQCHQPEVPIVALVLDGLEVPSRVFDDVIRLSSPEPYVGDLRYLNKLVHPVALSPFERTLFLDDDTLVIRPFAEVVESEFRGRAVALNTRHDGPSTPRVGTNHLDPAQVCRAFGRDVCVNTYGGGHFYFEDRAMLRDLARVAIEFATTRRDVYRRLAAQDAVSDELVLLLAVNEVGYSMPTVVDLVDAFSLRTANRIRFDVPAARYEWPGRPWGESIDAVRVLHFCSSSKRALPYRRAIHSLTGLRQSFDVGWRGFRSRQAMRWAMRRGAA